MAGFGRSTFGVGTFGISDTGLDLVVTPFPVQYYSNQEDITQDPLYIFLQVYANSVNQRRLDIENMEQLTDFETAPENILQALGTMFGLDIDQNEPQSLQRSFVANASQWLQIKASTPGYRFRGLASGFNVAIDNFWKINPITVAPFIPLGFQYHIKSQYADPSAPTYLYTDQPPGTFAGTPTQETPDYAKSTFIRIVYTLPPDSPLLTTPGVDFNTLLDNIIAKIFDVVGIHQEVTENQYLIKIPVTETESAEMIEAMESAIINVGEACYFDFIPADVEPLDQCLRLLQANEEDDQTIIVVEAITDALIESDETATLSVTEIDTDALVESDEELIIPVSEGALFDVIPADIVPLDDPSFLSVVLLVA